MTVSLVVIIYMRGTNMNFRRFTKRFFVLICALCVSCCVFLKPADALTIKYNYFSRFSSIIKTIYNNNTSSKPNNSQNSNQETTSKPSGSTSTNTSSSVSSSVSEIFNLLNEERTKNGLKAFTLNSALTKVAQTKAEEMAKKNYFSQ